LTQVTDDFTTFTVDVPSNLLGSTAQIKLELDFDGDGDNTTLLIDNVFFSTLIATDDSGDPDDGVVFFLEQQNSPLPPSQTPAFGELVLEERVTFDEAPVPATTAAAVGPQASSVGIQGSAAGAEEEPPTFGLTHTIFYTNPVDVPISVRFALQENEFLSQATIIQDTPNGPGEVQLAAFQLDRSGGRLGRCRGSKHGTAQHPYR